MAASLLSPDAAVFKLEKPDSNSTKSPHCSVSLKVPSARSNQNATQKSATRSLTNSENLSLSFVRKKPKKRKKNDFNFCFCGYSLRP